MSSEESFLDFAADDTMAGFRLHRLELYNWGTFHGSVKILQVDGRNSLLTGDIGSGKSTMVDAITTLLVPANRVAYNRAAGAAFRERDLKSYVMGYYKSERSDGGYSAKPVALRSKKDFSVILGLFRNEGYDQTVTLAQVFWQKESQGQPARIYVVSDSDLSIAEHFSGFGPDISGLRKSIRNLPKTEPVFDSFTSYGAAFRRRFGLKSDQALELFHQTVSLKSVGNLTNFVREHMLESFDVAPRIDALIGHFDDLNRSHEAVLKAKEQIKRLLPLTEHLDRHGEAAKRSQEWLSFRTNLRSYFGHLKVELLDKRLANLSGEWDKAHLREEGLREKRSGLQEKRDELKRSIAESGGDRLETLKRERRRSESERETKLDYFHRHEELCKRLELPVAKDGETFLDNLHHSKALLEELEARDRELQNSQTELEVELAEIKRSHQEITDEILSLKGRKSNIDSRQVSIRNMLCDELEINPRELPFAGELIAVREADSDWEGAIERLLRSFGLSLLVPDEHYRSVSDWVDRTRLRGRLVYYRTRDKETGAPLVSPEKESLLSKLELKRESPLIGWLEQELSRRFDYTCCSDMELFRRSARALTRAGQIKGSPYRHEKDDRHRIDDRSRYILGWRNEAKIQALTERKEALEEEMRLLTERRNRITEERKTLGERRELLFKLQAFDRFEQIEWQPLALRIEELEKEILRLEESSDILKTLNRELEDLEKAYHKTDIELSEATSALATLKEKISVARSARTEAEEARAESELSGEELLSILNPVRLEALGKHTLTVESCENREREMREWIQGKIDAEAKRIKSLEEQIFRSMHDFRRDYPAETREMDESLAGGDEFRKLLQRLQGDDLPRFEEKFKQLLNENTIREIANFQAQLNREVQEIRERVERINRSLSAIEYNKDRYILLEDQFSTDPEIKGFRQELKSCTEGSFTGSTDEQYTEAKFLQVKAIINRFRGREGTTELDARWSAKVTDVRNWFVFAASERWKEDNREYEHYTDSGGKSGGQKEKLAYTVLAASLAYQFGLEWGETRSRSFRFVVIDEAFGKGSDESARFGLELFTKLNLQLLIVTPLTKLHIIEPFVSTVGFVHNENGSRSLLRTLTIQEYRREISRSKEIAAGAGEEAGEKGKEDEL
jgi:uncharacterized protein YPO0396